METVYFGLFHGDSPAYAEALCRALVTYGNVEAEEWGAFWRVSAIRRNAA